MEGLIQIGGAVALLVLAMFTGSIIERRHYASIRAREAQFQNLPAIPYELPAGDEQPLAEVRMVMGSTVVSIDYFKQFLFGLRTLVGGRVSAFESVLDRGRREAVLRMKEQFPDADIIVNMRLETSTVSASTQKALNSVEVLAYGTALKYRK
jgi:uncharacterized protein YbjQ (UPF0145 family)